MTLMQQRMRVCLFFFFQAEDGIRDLTVTGVQTCALPISVNGDVKRLFIHRKGATRAFGPGHPDVPEPFRAVGQPVLIGGTMGTGPYILCRAAEGMRRSFGSAAPGAGRSMSRTQATQRCEGPEAVADLGRRGILI